MQVGRECAGYEVTQYTATGSDHGIRPLLPAYSGFTTGPTLPRQLFDRSETLSANEGYAIDYFRGQSSFQLPGCSMVSSWETLALRLSRTETAIQYAVIALGAIHRARGPDTPATATPYLDPDHHQFALQSYDKAVSGVQQYFKAAKRGADRSRVEMILLASLMFMSFDVLQGQYRPALMHRATGLKILAELTNSTRNHGDGRPLIKLTQTPTAAIDILSQAFVCVDYDLAMSSGVVPKLEAILANEHDTIGPTFGSLDDARMHLNILTNAVSRLRSDLEAIAEQEMLDNDVDVRDTELHSSWIQSRGMMIDLEDHPEVLQRVSQIRLDVSAWSSAFASISPTSAKEANAIRMMLQIQFMSVSLRNTRNPPSIANILMLFRRGR